MMLSIISPSSLITWCFFGGGSNELYIFLSLLPYLVHYWTLYMLNKHSIAKLYPQMPPLLCKIKNHMCMNALLMYRYVPGAESEEGIVDSCEPPCRHWEPKHRSSARTASTFPVFPSYVYFMILEGEDPLPLDLSPYKDIRHL